MIPISIPNLSGNEGRYLASCVETGFVSSVGDYVGRFAADVARCAGAGSRGETAAPTSSGTAALHLSLLAAGVTRNDLVILPSLTFIASANAVTYCGADPWLLDIDMNSWTLDPQKLAAILAKETKRQGDNLIHVPTGRRVAAIMPVYMLGTPADMDPIIRIANENGLPVICDAAAALGARYREQPVGTLNVTASAFSFNGNKTFTCGGGGAVISGDSEFITVVNHLATTARVGTNYDHDCVGFNYRMTNLNAAVGCAQLEQFEPFLSRKRQIAKAYEKAFAALDMLCPFPVPGWAESAHWLSGVFLDVPSEQAEYFIIRLREFGVDARPFWKPVHLQAPYRATPKSDLTLTEQLYKKIVPLPCSTHLSDTDLDQVIESVTSLAKRL